MNLMEQKFSIYQHNRRKHWDAVAVLKDTHGYWGKYYHERLIQIYRMVVAPGQKVIEIGCRTGELLASLKPSFGLGIDFSEEMVRQAARNHPEFSFILADAHQLGCIRQKFDVIILSDLVNDLWDVQEVFNQIAEISSPATRLILNTYSRLWELPLRLAQTLKVMTPLLPQNWLTQDDIFNLLNLSDFEVIRRWTEILWTFDTPVLAKFFNSFAVKIWPLRYFALTNFIIARPFAPGCTVRKKPSVSVVIPARNEAGNVSRIFEQMPEMGPGTEMIFVEGHSADDTYAVIEKEIQKHPERQCLLFRQTGKGKGDAVRLGFAHAGGEILMILDADLTVLPEELPRFYDALISGKGEFINGVRLVYPMEKQAMRYLNLIGNKFFSLAFSWLLEQPVKDTLCGTKVLWKYDYERIAANRAYFGDFDPFGDFDLLFGAAKLNLKIADMPIRYNERTYGSTNIRRWKHGWLLLRMIMFAAGRMKFV